MVEQWSPKPKVKGSNPFSPVLGLSRLELLTLRLSGVRSNQLSYRPFMSCSERVELSTSGSVVRRSIH